MFCSNKGMQFLVGENWKDYFDVVIVQARKPKFFTDESRPLRIYDEVKQTQLWDRVTKLNKGVIYLEVSLSVWYLKNLHPWDTLHYTFLIIEWIILGNS